MMCIYYLINNNRNKESFSDNILLKNKVSLDTVLNNNYHKAGKQNPFNNVLLTDITDNPDRKSAPPLFNPDVLDNTTNNVKKSVQDINNNIPNTNEQLFGDLWEKHRLDTSNRNFYSTSNTKVTNDQSAFANYLYGNMPSSKESNSDGAFARVQNNGRYTLY